MYSILLIGTFLAVLWLVAWSLRDRRKPSAYWWPFDMREPSEGAPVPAPAQGRSTAKAAAALRTDSARPPTSPKKKPR